MSRTVTVRASPLPDMDDPIWLLGHEVVRVLYEFLIDRQLRRSEVWG